MQQHTDVQKYQVVFKKQSQTEEYRRKRAEDMLALYQSGKTLDQIGIKYDLTRERVRQIVTSYFPIEYKQAKQDRRDARLDAIEERKPKPIIHICKVCGYEFQAMHSNRSYCSSEHYDLWHKHFRNILDHEATRMRNARSLLKHPDEQKREWAEKVLSGKHEQNRWYLSGESLQWAMWAYDNNWPIFNLFPQVYKDYTIRKYYEGE